MVYLNPEGGCGAYVKGFVCGSYSYILAGTFYTFPFQWAHRTVVHKVTQHSSTYQNKRLYPALTSFSLKEVK